MSMLLLLALTLACADPKDTGEPLPLWPSLTEQDGVKVVQLGGTPYEMGLQQGELLGDLIAEGGEWAETSELAIAEGLADYYGLLDLAYTWAFPEIVDECQGLVDAVGSEHWTLDRCMVLAHGDVILEQIYGEVYGCSQLVAGGAATADGHLVHGRNLDWTQIPFIIDNPTLLVRHPEGGTPWVAVGFPGNVAPYNGINAAGLALLTDEAYPAQAPDPAGHSQNQMVYRLLSSAATVSDVKTAFEGEDHASTEIVVASDASGDAAVFELAVGGMALRPLSDDGLVYATNHFVDPAMVPLHEATDPTSGSSSRYLRLAELLEPGGEASLYGTLDLAVAQAILRDTTNPVTGQTCDPSVFDGCGTLANNGAMQSMVLRPQDDLLYVAAGTVPVPQQPFVGFRVSALVEGWADLRAQPPLMP